MPPLPPPLPDFLRPFFWDTSFEELSWEAHSSFITRRILRAGDWQAIGWLRQAIGEDGLRLWLARQRGGGLSPRQLRFWMIILDLDPAQVDRWVERAKESPWEQRTRP